MIVALTGGVGGAKLAWGLNQILAPDRLKIIVNTGDDFEHLGLHIAPDLDTMMYTLAGIANRNTGWGVADEQDSGVGSQRHDVSTATGLTEMTSERGHSHPLSLPLVFVGSHGTTC